MVSEGRDPHGHCERLDSGTAAVSGISPQCNTPVTRWREVEPDVRPRTITEFLRNVDPVNAVDLICRSFRAPLVLIAGKCRQRIRTHTLSSRNEMGGLLIGVVYSLPYSTESGYDFATFITDSVPSTRPCNSPVSLRMDVDIWNETRSHIGRGKIVVGWYHSHPGIGAFFSGTDRSTQRAFFGNHYSLGVVVDPYRDEWECYFGADSIEMGCELGVMSDDAALGCLGSVGEACLP